MKKIVFFMILMISINSFAAETGSIIDKIDFHLSNTPSENGDKTFSYFRWLYNDNLSSGIYFVYEKRKTDTKLSGRADSLLVADTKDTILDFFPLEYNSSAGGFIKWRIGAGLNVTKNELEEKGYFVTSPSNPFHPSITEVSTTNHVYKNTSDSIFYTGKIQFEFFIRGFEGFLNISNRSEYIPYYYLMSSQDINITPLTVNGPVSNDYEGGSAPYLMNEVKIHIFKLFELQYQVEYQKLKYEQIGIDYNGSDWILSVNDENKYTIYNYSCLINFKPEIFEDVDFVIGFGKKWLNTKNETTGEKPVDESEWIYNIGVTSKRI